jgi:hypothetical protein
MQEAMAQMQRNMEFFFGRYIRNIARYEPDIETLKSYSCRIVGAVGAESQGQLADEGRAGAGEEAGDRGHRVYR